MKTSIISYYSEYGRYINRFRALPFYIDGLKPVERRLLLSLYREARNDFTKSAKVIGFCIGNLHPHGDLSTYESLHKLVMNGSAVGEGNWGGKGLDDDDPPGAPRYTECKLAKWVEDLAFKYLNYVDWINFEYETEPLILPSPIPIGLIGKDAIAGTSFYKTLVPRYTLQDLAKRLLWILDGEEGEEPVIAPNMRNSKNNSNDYTQILRHGYGEVKVTPEMYINDNGNYSIGGKPMGLTFKSIKQEAQETGLFTLLDDSGVADDPYQVNILIQFKKKTANTQSKVTELWKKHLIKTYSFLCNFTDEEGYTLLLGIDSVLVKNYEMWKQARLRKRQQEFNKLNNDYIDNNIINLIREIILERDSKKLDDIIQYFESSINDNKKSITYEHCDESGNFSSDVYNITSDDIKRTCNNKSISKLVEVSIDFSQIKTNIQNKKLSINQINTDCYEDIKSLTQN